MQNADDSPSGPDENDGPGVDPTEATFDDWIDHVADAEGVPPESVRARLMSSYWILDELAQHLDETSFEALSDELAAEEFTAMGSAEDNDRIRTILEELLADARSMEPHRPADAERPSWERLVGLVESAQADTTAGQHGRSDPGKRSDRPAEGAALEELESELTDRLAQLEAMLEAVEAEVDRLDAVLTGQSEQVTDIDGRLEAQSARLQRLEDILRTLAEKLEALDGPVETNRDRLEQLESTIDDYGNHFQELQHSVSEHEVELDNAAEVLRYLFDEVDDLHDHTADIASELRALDPVVSAHHEREQLDSLKEAAAELGVRTAECEACEQTVDLGLLTEPACPHCETPAADVSSRSGLLFSKSVLETGERAEESDEPELASALAVLDDGSGR